MPSNIRVTPEQLHQVSGQLSAGASNIESILSQLRSQAGPLGGDWAGVAQARFITLWEQWQRDGQGLHEALTGIARLMQQAATNYETTEQSNANSFGKM